MSNIVFFRELWEIMKKDKNKIVKKEVLSDKHLPKEEYINFYQAGRLRIR